jgi:hypothetical protein
LRDLVSVEVEVKFRRRVEGEQAAEFRDVSKVAAELEAVIAAVPRQVVAELMLLLKRLLRHVAVATDASPSGKKSRSRSVVALMRLSNVWY